MKKTIVALVTATAATLALAQTAPAGAPRPAQPPHADGRPAGGPPSLHFPITREDALKRSAEQFDQMDANKDGKLTADEVRAFHERNMANRFPQGGARDAGPQGVGPSGAPSAAVPHGGPNSEPNVGQGRPQMGVPVGAERPLPPPAGK